MPLARAQAQPGAIAIGVVAEGETGVVVNPRFQPGADSATAVSRVSLGGSLVRRSARGSIGALLDGEAQRFRSAPDLSHLTYGGSASGGERLTERLTVAAVAGARTSLTRGLVTDAGIGIATPTPLAAGGDADAPAPGVPTPEAAPAPLPLLPLTLSHAYSARASAAYRTSPRTSVAGDIEADRVRYDARALASGTSLSAGFSLAHALTDATGVSAQLDTHRTETGGQTLATQSLRLGLDARLHGATQLRLAAGAAASVTHGRPAALSHVGSAELGGPALGGAWGVRYLRDVSPSLGVGDVLTSDRAGATYARVAPGGVQLRVGVEQGWSRGATAGISRTVTRASYAEARRAIAGGLWAGLGAAAHSRTQDPTVRSQNLSLTAGYARLW